MAISLRKAMSKATRPQQASANSTPPAFRYRCKRATSSCDQRNSR